MSNPTPQQVVNHMLQHDLYSQWLGITIQQVHEGSSIITMQVQPNMVNGLGIIHGGIAFALADSAFAFACNNRNNLSVALDTSINFIKAIHIGDTLIATATEVHNGRSTGLYHVSIANQHGALVAQFKGTCYRTGKQVIIINQLAE